MFITRRSFARLDALAHAQACTKQAMVETLLDKAWETAEGTMTQVVLWGD